MRHSLVMLCGLAAASSWLPALVVAPSPSFVQCRTTKGDILIKVEPSWAPLGAARFLEMVGAGYFTDMPLYRSVPNFLVQFGIQKDHPSFDKFCKGPPIQDDQNHQVQVRKGMIAFAGGGQNSRTCQIFVSYTDTNPHLGQQPWETPFASIVEGMSVVDAWATEYGDMPPWGQGPAPSKLEKEGNAYIRRDFPNIDFWQECSVLPAEQVAAEHQEGDEHSSSGRRRRAHHDESEV